MPQAVVEARGLGKTFGATPVLRAVDFTLTPGAAAIIVGGNGAGKSTLLRVIGGLSRPTAGQVRIFGVDGPRLGAQARRRIGMLTHQSWLYPNLTARENLEFYAALSGLANPARTAALWLERVGLGAFGGERVRGFSRGMEQRLSLARALAPGPDLLLLDEPFSALDPAGVALVSELLRSEVARGCAVLMTAHGPQQIGEVELVPYEISRGRLAPYDAEGRRGWLRSRLGRQAQ